MEPMTILAIGFIFALGACVGSFLNVIIDRVPAGLPITGRSTCDNCQKQLGAGELIPVLSFIIQGGRCADCHNRLSWQYPIVEAMTGLLFIVSFLRLPGLFSSSSLTFNFLLLTFYFFWVSSLIILAIIDLKTSLLPDEVSLPAIVVSLIYLLLTPSAILTNLATAITTALFFFLIIVLTRGRGMGEGDIRLGFLMGLVLGWPKALIALYIAFLSGAIISLILIAFHKKTLKQTVPFGPFLILGTFTMMFLGNEIQQFWLKIFGF